MNTTDQVLLIIITVLLSILLLTTIIAVVGLVKLINVVRRVVLKAEDVVDSVESAAEIFKDTEGSLAAFKVIRNIIKVANKRSRK